MSVHRHSPVLEGVHMAVVVQRVFDTLLACDYDREFDYYIR